jgi:stage V sporulation protein G
MEDVKIEVARLRKLNDNGSLKAFADIVVGNSFLIKGMRVIEGKKGFFVGMPQGQGKDGKWYPHVFPVTKEAKEVLEEIVLNAYALQ